MLSKTIVAPRFKSIAVGGGGPIFAPKLAEKSPVFHLSKAPSVKTVPARHRQKAVETRQKPSKGSKQSPSQRSSKAVETCQKKNNRRSTLQVDRRSPKSPIFAEKV